MKFSQSGAVADYPTGWSKDVAICRDNYFKGVLIIGDRCLDTLDLVVLRKRHLLISVLDRMIYLHVGTKNLGANYNGGYDCNGGRGKREVPQSTADLLSTTKKSFPQAKIVLSSVIIRVDITWKALYAFNKQLAVLGTCFESPSEVSAVDIIQEAKCVYSWSERGFTAIGKGVAPSGTDNGIAHVNIRSSFLKSTTNKKSDFSFLPPTKQAAKQHFYGTYRQVRKWLENQTAPSKVELGTRN
ncbi:hypothetical protein J6590_019187 [Homalodisca vitripennis]|nr:hypothetical protein J6590_019187 [Homalodisca vitripennis]